MALLTGDQILAANDLPYEDVDVPEWEGQVRVRRITATEWWKITEDGQKPGALRADTRFCAVAMIGEDGKRLFTDDQVAALSEKSWPAMERIREVAMRLSGLGKEEVKAIEKNS